MSSEWGVAAVGASAAIIGGVLSGAYSYGLARYQRPRLNIDYADGPGHFVEAEYIENGKPTSWIHIRACVRNNGHQIAKGCRVFLTTLHEVRSDGTVANRVLYDSKMLSWAGWRFAAVDVPPGVEFFVDLMRVSKNDPGWHFSVEELFASQWHLKDHAGTYRFGLMVSGDNAEPARCAVNVDYKRDWRSLRAWKV